MQTYKLPVKIYYEDTDAGGVVYHSNYLKYAERGRTEVLNQHGITSNALTKNDGLAFMVKNCTIDFIKAAYLEDSLEVETKIIHTKGASAVFQQDITRDGEILVAIKVLIVCVDLAKAKPARIPDNIREVFEK